MPLDAVLTERIARAVQIIGPLDQRTHGMTPVAVGNCTADHESTFSAHVPKLRFAHVQVGKFPFSSVIPDRNGQANTRRNKYAIVRGVDEPRKSAVIAICASILAARKLVTAPRNSPLYVSAIADAVADARRIVERIEQDRTPKRDR